MAGCHSDSRDNPRIEMAPCPVADEPEQSAVISQYRGAGHDSRSVALSYLSTRSLTLSDNSAHFWSCSKYRLTFALFITASLDLNEGGFQAFQAETSLFVPAAVSSCHAGKKHLHHSCMTWQPHRHLCLALAWKVMTSVRPSDSLSRV